MSKYELNFRKLIVQMLPFSLRGNLVDFLEVLISPLKKLYYKFLTFKQDNEKLLSFNAQMPRLQGLLNNYFGTSSIYIEDALYNELDGVWENLEYKPKEIGFWGIIGKDEIGYDGFRVYVPVVLKEKEDVIISLINRYKFAGTSYKIIWFN